MASNYKVLLFLGIFVFLFFNFGCVANSPIAIGILEICGLFMSALPIVLMLVVVLAALVYAVGQMIFAETRARATVWATSLMTGAIIAALIFILLPYVLDKLAPDLGIEQAKGLCSLFASQYGDSGSTPPGGSCGGVTCGFGQFCSNNQCVFIDNTPEIPITTSCGGGCPSGKICIGSQCVDEDITKNPGGGITPPIVPTCVPHSDSCTDGGVPCCSPYSCVGGFQPGGGKCY